MAAASVTQKFQKSLSPISQDMKLFHRIIQTGKALSDHPVPDPHLSTECHVQGEAISTFWDLWHIQLCVGFPFPISPFPFLSPGLVRAVDAAAVLRAGKTKGFN